MMIPHVLIVEDTVEHRDALRDYLQLRKPQWRFLVAGNEEEGARIIDDQLAKQEPVSVVLTDLGLDRTVKDDKGGLDMITAAAQRDRSIIVILYSVLSDVDRNDAFTRGAFDVVERNVAGTAAAREILLKMEVALRYRDSLDRVQFLNRFVDRKVIHTVDENLDSIKMQKRMITICFWDIEGFSRCCEDLKAKPELIASFLKDYCEVAAKTIFSQNGVLDKFIGDGVMALFGVLSSNPGSDHGASAAAETALSLRTAFDTLVRSREEEWTVAADGRKVRIGLRCGIHTGEALVGCAGTDFRDQFTALGASVNLAARIEKEADGKQRQILVSLSTRNFLGSRYKLDFVKEINKVRNIDGSFEVFALSHN